MEALTGINLAPYAHALRMIWDPEPSNDTVSNAPVWCLGRSYRLGSSGTQSPRTPAKSESPPLQSSSLLETPPDSISSSFDSSLAYDETQEARGWPPAFRDDFESRIWLSYRSGFELIPRSQDPKALSALSFKMRLKTQLIDHDGFTSDSGWGCMIRTGQSLLANAMLLNTLGRNWRRAAGDNGEFPILAKFADDPRAPYSVHNFVNHGTRACGMYPGEWFGPSATARCIQALTSQHDDPLRVYSTADGSDVYQDAFFEVAKDGDTFHPTLILVSTRLGIDKITPVYWEALIASLQMPQSVGIAGGRPSSSHYFVGAQGQYLFFLDPHTTQPALPYKTDPDDYTLDEVNTCHTRRLRCLHVREMDPSMLIGFLIKDEEDWDDWRRCVKHVQGKAVINVADSDPVTKGLYTEREGAIDEVETLSDDEDTWLDK